MPTEEFLVWTQDVHSGNVETAPKSEEEEGGENFLKEQETPATEMLSLSVLY